jgi:hypothetical protein
MVRQTERLSCCAYPTYPPPYRAAARLACTATSWGSTSSTSTSDTSGRSCATAARPPAAPKVPTGLSRAKSSCPPLHWAMQVSGRRFETAAGCRRACCVGCQLSGLPSLSCGPGQPAAAVSCGCQEPALLGAGAPAPPATCNAQQGQGIVRQPSGWPAAVSCGATSQHCWALVPRYDRLPDIYNKRQGD